MSIYLGGLLRKRGLRQLHQLRLQLQEQNLFHQKLQELPI